MPTLEVSIYEDHLLEDGMTALWEENAKLMYAVGRHDGGRSARWHELAAEQRKVEELRNRLWPDAEELTPPHP